LIALLLSAPLWAGAPVLTLPDWPDPVEGECPGSIPIRAGEQAPAELFDETGLAKCTAVAEPVSSLAHLLAVEQYALSIGKIHALDVQLLEADRDYWLERHKRDTDLPWYERPAAQRWAGRLEVLVLTAVVAGTVAATVELTYNWNE
jgi:hypothetical protein